MKSTASTTTTAPDALPHLSPSQVLQEAQLTVLDGTMLRITERVEATSFTRGYRDTNQSGVGPTGHAYYLAYSTSRDNFMVCIVGLGLFRAERLTREEKAALVAEITPAPLPDFAYEVNAGYGDTRPVHFFVTLADAYEHCAQVLGFKRREDDLAYGERLLPGGEWRLRGSGLRWVRLLAAPVPQSAPLPRYNLGQLVKCLGQTGWLSIQEREYRDGAWRYRLTQRVDPMTAELLTVRAVEANIAVQGEKDPNAADDSRPGHSLPMQEVLREMDIPMIEKTDLQIERYSRAFFFGKLTSASTLLDSGRSWEGWRSLRYLLEQGVAVEYWMSPDYDQLVYTSQDKAGDTYWVPFKGYSILEGPVSYPALARCATVPPTATEVTAEAHRQGWVAVAGVSYFGSAFADWDTLELAGVSEGSVAEESRLVARRQDMGLYLSYRGYFYKCWLHTSTSKRSFNIQDFTNNNAAEVMATSTGQAAMNYRQQHGIIGYARLHITDSIQATSLTELV